MNPKPLLLAGLLIIVGVVLLYQQPLLVWSYSLSFWTSVILLVVVALAGEKLASLSNDHFVKTILQIGTLCVCGFLFFRSCSIGVQKVKQLASAKTQTGTDTARPTAEARNSVPTSSVPQPSREIPTPTPLPSFGVKQLSEYAWRVTLPEGGWYDTGIPVVANVEILITSAGGKGKFMIKIKNRQMFSGNWSGKPGKLIMVSEEDYWHSGDNQPIILVDYDFTDTIKLKIDDEGGERAMLLNVALKEGPDRCNDSENKVNPNIHNPTRVWAAQMREKIARK